MYHKKPPLDQIIDLSLCHPQFLLHACTQPQPVLLESQQMHRRTD